MDVRDLLYKLREVCSEPAEDLTTFLDVFSRQFSELIILVASHGDCVVG